MRDGWDLLSTLFGCAVVGGAYVWGKNKGHEKASFENAVVNQQSEINQLRLEIAEMKKQKATPPVFLEVKHD